MERASGLPIAHLSVYILSIDSNTVFEYMVKRGEFRLEDEEVMAGRYQRVCERLKELGFEHYEISNLPGTGDTPGIIHLTGNRSHTSVSALRLILTICIPGNGTRRI